MAERSNGHGIVGKVCREICGGDIFERRCRNVDTVTTRVAYLPP